MKHWVVTGAAGFIGSRFVEACQKRSDIVLTCVDQESAFTSRNEMRGLDFRKTIDRSHFLQTLTDPKNLLDRPRPDFDAIIHLGAITDTRETNVDLLNRYNLEYSKAIWNFASLYRIPLIYASSAATYGDGSLGYDDSEELIPDLRPLNLYGESKQAFDLWALAEEKLGNHPPSWAGFKFFNVYGFGERHKEFMASVVLHAFDQIRKSGDVTLFKSHKQGIADGYQKRDFIYVDDVVDVLFFALQKPILRGIYNLGTGQARTFLDLTRATFKALGQPEDIRFIDTPVSIRDKYQYFTQAPMARLREAGYAKAFTELEVGIDQYVARLARSR